MGLVEGDISVFLIVPRLRSHKDPLHKDKMEKVI